MYLPLSLSLFYLSLSHFIGLCYHFVFGAITICTLLDEPCKMRASLHLSPAATLLDMTTNTPTHISTHIHTHLHTHVHTHTQPQSGISLPTSRTDETYVKLCFLLNHQYSSIATIITISCISKYTKSTKYTSSLS